MGERWLISEIIKRKKEKITVYVVTFKLIYLELL